MSRVPASWYTLHADGPSDTDDRRVKLLWASVVHRAIADHVLYRKSNDIRKRRMFKEAQDWLFSDEYEEFTSFLSICGILDADPIVVRRCVSCMIRDDLQDLRAYLGLGR